MIINYDLNPKKSILFTASIILKTIKEGVTSLDSLIEKCLDKKIGYNSVFLSIDWLYLLGYIKKINGDEIVLWFLKD